MTQKWENWQSSTEHYKPVRREYEVVSFEPKVVEELPRKLETRGNRRYYVSDKARELAKANRGKWILSYQQDIPDSKARMKRASSMRSSLFYINGTEKDFEGKVITTGTVVELYIRYE